MDITAIVIQAEPGCLRVKNICNKDELLVNSRDADHFRAGDCLKISCSGHKAHGKPPQITASSIHRIRCPDNLHPAPVRMKALVLRSERGYFMAWDMNENKLVRVDFPGALQLRAGQRVIIEHNRIVIDDNPPRIHASRVSPM